LWLGIVIGWGFGWCLGCWVTALRYEFKDPSLPVVPQEVREFLTKGLARLRRLW